MNSSDMDSPKSSGMASAVFFAILLVIFSVALILLNYYLVIILPIISVFYKFYKNIETIIVAILSIFTTFFVANFLYNWLVKHNDSWKKYLLNILFVYLALFFGVIEMMVVTGLIGRILIYSQLYFLLSLLVSLGLFSFGNYFFLDYLIRNKNLPSAQSKERTNILSIFLITVGIIALIIFDYFVSIVSLLIICDNEFMGCNIIPGILIFIAILAAGLFGGYWIKKKRSS